MDQKEILLQVKDIGGSAFFAILGLVNTFLPLVILAASGYYSF